MTLLRLWLAATAVLLAAIAAWAFAPVLVFVVLVVAGLALVSVAMITLARLLRRLREGTDHGGPTPRPVKSPTPDARPARLAIRWTDEHDGWAFHTWKS